MLVSIFLNSPHITTINLFPLSVYGNGPMTSMAILSIGSPAMHLSNGALSFLICWFSPLTYFAFAYPFIHWFLHLRPVICQYLSCVFITPKSPAPLLSWCSSMISSSIHVHFFASCLVCQIFAVWVLIHVVNLLTYVLPLSTSFFLIPFKFCTASSSVISPLACGASIWAGSPWHSITIAVYPLWPVGNVEVEPSSNLFFWLFKTEEPGLSSMIRLQLEVLSH